MRDEKLTESWLGEIILAGKPLHALSIGRIQKLKLLGNECFTESANPDELTAILEVVFVMSLDKKDFIEYARKTNDERVAIVSDFAIEHEDELGDVIHRVMDAVGRIGIAKMENKEQGKEISRAY